MPSVNPIITRKQTERFQDIHKFKLRTAKSSINNKPPRSWGKAPKRNLKREQMLEERFSSIERENRILLEKMSHIMTHNTLDNSNPTKKYSHSLNREHRKRQLTKITQDNMAILRRIQRTEPTYSTVKWEQERKRMEHLIENIQQIRPGTTGGKRGASRSASRQSRRPNTSQGRSMDTWDSPKRGISRSAPSPQRPPLGGDLLVHSEQKALAGATSGLWDLSVVEKGGTSASGEDGMRGIEIWGRQRDQECAVGLTVDQLRELISGATEDADGSLRVAIDLLRLLDSHGIFSRLSSETSDSVREQLISVLIGRLTVVSDADGLAFQLLA